MEKLMKTRTSHPKLPQNPKNIIYDPNGKQYPLRFELREPTPEDLVFTYQEVSLNSNQGEPELSKLSPDEIKHLNKRLPEIKTEKEDEQEFKAREKSLKTPIIDDEKLQEFPPKESYAPPKMEEITLDATELKIERYLPEGKVPMASQLT
jgi:hypothetical protein